MMTTSIPERAVRPGLIIVLALGCAIALPDQPAAAAHVDRIGIDWEKIAACESNSRWHTNTGNGYYGGLQVAPSTWRSYGGHRYAPRADLATRAQQIAVGREIARHRGLAPWPICGYRGARHLRATARHTAHATGRVHWRVHRPAGAATSPKGPASPYGTWWLVQPGDCLSDIAERVGLPGGVQTLYELNERVLRHGPDRVRPGRRLRLHP